VLIITTIDFSNSLLHRQLWLLVVESKGNTFSLEVARPQALTYMLGNPIDRPNVPIFGLISNGVSFRFLKVMGQQFGESDEFYLRNTGDLIRVLQILRRLGDQIRT
jgi:hypothetical protein